MQPSVRHMAGDPEFLAWDSGLVLVATTIRAMTRAELTEIGKIQINSLNRNYEFQGDTGGRADISIKCFILLQNMFSVSTYPEQKLKMPRRVFSRWNCLRWTFSECCCYCRAPHSQSRISGPSGNLWRMPLSHSLRSRWASFGLANCSPQTWEE